MVKTMAGSCRISGSFDLIDVINLGTHQLCGHFPSSKEEEIPFGELRLGLSQTSGLLQLASNPPIEEMYGDNYGYRSGLNASMVAHLRKKSGMLVALSQADCITHVLDIGSNDGTLLNSYPSNIERFGIDPTITKFKEYYDEPCSLHAGFFDSASYLSMSGGKKAQIVTSLSMFYDLPDPLRFCLEVRDILDRDGLWHFEQSYMPSMLRTNSYDTICHEHLEYYSLHVVEQLLSKAKLKIIDVSFNSINGGSFAVTASHSDSRYVANKSIIDWMLRMEERMELFSPSTYRGFEHNAYTHRRDLKDLLETLKKDGKKVAGYGASTKGNVILQFCNITKKDVFAIAEINEYKYGRYTPGSYIPIRSEEEVRKDSPDYMLVLPWHFRPGIISREQEFLSDGGKLIFPLPEIEIVG